MWDPLRSIVEASFNDARRDVHRMITQRRHWAFGILSCAWIATLAAFLTMLCLFSNGRLSQADSHGKACVLGGIFSLFPDSYTPWSTDGFFQINLSFGRLSFGEAKAIDVAWDIVCVLRLAAGSLSLSRLGGLHVQGCWSWGSSCVGVFQLADVCSVSAYEHGEEAGTYPKTIQQFTASGIEASVVSGRLLTDRMYR